MRIFVYSIVPLLMLGILSFIFGASIGSFVQVIATRLYVAPITKGRSKCLACGETLKAKDLVPVLSYLFLGGKCRYCKSKYGVSALIIEILYGAVFFLLYTHVLLGQVSFLTSLLWFMFYTALFVSLGVMALYDKEHSYVPTNFLILFSVLSTVMYVMRIREDQSFATAVSPLIVALPFFALWVITKGKGLGFGDVILFLGVGAFFGALQGFAVLVISVWAGALYGLYIKFIKEKQKRNLIAIPFVPFIVLAFIVVLFTDIDLFSIVNLFA